MPLLSGVIVLEMGTVATTPYAGQWLADLGADVIKIEAPDGDSTRRTGPTSEENMSAMFLGLNRSKRSIVLNLKTEPARQGLWALLERADIFLHNTRPSKMEKLGFSPDAILARNPRIIYGCLHGFGEAGPYGGRPAYDDIIQGASGLAHLVALQTGEARYVPTAIADKTTGLFAVIAILAALSKRDRTGAGSALEIPMFESMVAFNLVEHLYGAAFVPPLSTPAYPRIMASHRRPFPTSDGHVCMMPYTDEHWRAFFTAASAPQLADDSRFKGMSARTRNIEELYRLAAEFIALKTTREWVSLCDLHDIPCSPMRSIDDLLNDEHLQATGFFSDLEDTKMGRIRVPGVPVLVDGVRPGVRFPPRLGQHTREILLEAGLDNARIDEIEASTKAAPG